MIAIAHLFGQNNVPSKIEKMVLKGHYGNEITTLRMSLRGVHAESFFHRIWTRLPEAARHSIIEGLETRVDSGGRLYLRLDKQAAYQREFQMTEQDPVKLEVSFKNNQDSAQDQLALLRQMLESETFSPHMGERSSNSRAR